MKDGIVIENVSKTFKTKEGIIVNALENVSLQVENNEFICIIGPSGCGKSTLLRMIGGLEKCTDGKILYKDKEMLKPTREVGFVFQDYSLLPWRTVIENISLGLEFRGISKSERYQHSMEFLDIIGMRDFEKAYPYELSGGMQQRVAIARALANDPDVLLMDEPFGALDAYTRIVLQRELLRIWETNKKTILFVTHSVDEAVFLADKVIVMSSNPGKIKEVVDINMSRPRDRGNPEYGKLTSNLLGMLEDDLKEKAE